MDLYIMFMHVYFYMQPGCEKFEVTQNIYAEGK